MKTFTILLLCAFAAALQPAYAVSPIPEPGVIIYGKVTDSSRNATVPISGVNWTISTGGKSVILAVGSGIETSILNGETWYIARIPFGSTNVQGTTTDPVSATTFESTQAPTVYSRSVVAVNGVVAQLTAPAGNTFTFPSSAGIIELGRTERADLVIPHNLGAAYSTWAIERWGNIYSPAASSLSDPDGDGKNNENEFFAGTDPSDAKSNLSVSTSSLSGGLFNFGWQSVPGKIYQIQTSTSLTGAWSNIGSPITASAASTSTSIAVPQPQIRQFFRVAVLP